jgi:copper homeostasis protein
LKILLEIACFNFESALIAQKAGAHRIELCENYKEGGVTPSKELIRTVKQSLSIPVIVMIRPRPGNFIYTDTAFALMKNDISFCKEQGCNGLVFGILTGDHKIDAERCKELIELARPLPCTFHRAFDFIENSEEALEQLIAIGFSRLLTSGKAKSALEGSAGLKKLIAKASDRVTIIPGGGIRSSNVSMLILNTGATEIHSAAINDDSETASQEEIKKILNSI